MYRHAQKMLEVEEAKQVIGRITFKEVYVQYHNRFGQPTLERDAYYTLLNAQRDGSVEGSFAEWCKPEPAPVPGVVREEDQAWKNYLMAKENFVKAKEFMKTVPLSDLVRLLEVDKIKPRTENAYEADIASAYDAIRTARKLGVDTGIITNLCRQPLDVQIDPMTGLAVTPQSPVTRWEYRGEAGSLKSLQEKLVGIPRFELRRLNTLYQVRPFEGMTKQELTIQAALRHLKTIKRSGLVAPISDGQVEDEQDEQAMAVREHLERLTVVETPRAPVLAPVPKPVLDHAVAWVLAPVMDPTPAPGLAPKPAPKPAPVQAPVLAPMPAPSLALIDDLELSAPEPAPKRRRVMSLHEQLMRDVERNGWVGQHETLESIQEAVGEDI
jgi:hypothetical protein